MLAFKTLSLTPKYFVLVSTHNNSFDVKLNSKNIYQDYIQRLTLFLYSKYFFPKAFSMFLSSSEMKRSSIKAIKTKEKIKAVKEPMINAAPNKIKNIPKYMGCLLILKGPETSKELGIKCGLTVVLLFLNIESALKLRKIPKIISKAPM